jgi:hypothetical protein
MKPESHRALMELISYGVEELSNEDAAQLMSRVHECRECTGQWVLFQKTYTVLSQTGQTEVSVERSQQMWLTCLEHAKHKDHALESADGQPDHKSKSEVVPVSFRSDSSQREGDRRPSSASIYPFPFLKSSFVSRLPYALAAGAFALLATAYFASPTPEVAPTAPVVALQNTLPATSAARSLVSFAAPPRATVGMIDYHSAMGFEPFSDHLAPTLIATSATHR